jgi:hypothetical protein
MRAGLPQVQAPEAQSACMQQAAILQQQHKQQKQKLPEAQEGGREAHKFLKKRNKRKFS